MYISNQTNVMNAFPSSKVFPKLSVVKSLKPACLHPCPLYTPNDFLVNVPFFFYSNE